MYFKLKAIDILKWEHIDFWYLVGKINDNRNTRKERGGGEVTKVLSTSTCDHICMIVYINTALINFQSYFQNLHSWEDTRRGDSDMLYGRVFFTWSCQRTCRWSWCPSGPSRSLQEQMLWRHFLVVWWGTLQFRSAFPGCLWWRCSRRTVRQCAR